MATARHLSKAPIIEAIIDFKVNLPKSFEPELLSNLLENISNEYPLKKPLKRFIGSMGIMEGKPFVKQNVDDKISGYIYRTQDEKNVAQFRIDGLTFSRLSPYTEWKIVRDEAKKLWEIYCSVGKPEVIRRIAVRYINRIDLDSPSELEDYFIEPVKLPKSLPQEFVNFFFKVTVCKDELLANITQTTQPMPDKNKIGIIFDIDVYKEDNSGINSDNIWQIFEQLRELKNKIFFESITEKTAEMYE